jgi:hypothetical protein
MFWSDVNDTRGFHIFDTETYELEFIENPFNIFEKIDYNDTNYKDFDYSIVENKNVKVVIQNRTNQSDYELFISEILKRNIIDLKIVENNDINDSKINLVEFECGDTLGILNKYIDEADFKVNKNIIKKIISDTYREALEIEV